MGKTAFAQLIAQSTLDKYTDAPIQFYSQEMPAEQLVQRFMSMRSRISLQSIRQATELTEPEWAKVSEAMGYIMNNWQDRLLIDDEPSLSPYRLQDCIIMPKRELFHTSCGYYATVLHACGHATGHQSRLNREAMSNTGFSTQENCYRGVDC